MTIKGIMYLLFLVAACIYNVCLFIYLPYYHGLFTAGIVGFMVFMAIKYPQRFFKEPE